ncbi:uncharacterized protein BO97DRAFT_397078 [Aspergillus homomorphus CBS 101889]|uniref:Uncharacterized protein n=1 Tax=Aspergillus homomorphus (strain CBS 101889) TaxID=1450537 RepID=A0A395HNP9_ASPHC|nr:hypothetical protein BO97DRAFT_397078 [Aspergillus homomorphus CBS 101889]RAL09109.1 hypothetical protein BO97DRAFT_397078 [Aspergillus homomorphus CBS 101889]
MASILRVPSLRANLMHGFLRKGARAMIYPRQISSCLVRQAPINKNSASKDPRDHGERPGYWKYDLSFKGQMGKAVFFVTLMLVGSVESWSWYRDVRSWWKGVPDDGAE